jgi:toxin FitB
MNYVVDTDVLSHTSPSSAHSIAGLSTWLQRNSACLHLSVVSLMEISYGIAWLRHRRATRKARLLQAWLEDLIAFHEPRIVKIDHEIALKGGTEPQACGRARQRAARPLPS